jgi:hypothetical protein
VIGAKFGNLVSNIEGWMVGSMLGNGVGGIDDGTTVSDWLGNNLVDDNVFGDLVIHA